MPSQSCCGTNHINRAYLLIYADILEEFYVVDKINRGFPTMIQYMHGKLKKNLALQKLLFFYLNINQQ